MKYLLFCLLSMGGCGVPQQLPTQNPVSVRNSQQPSAQVESTMPAKDAIRNPDSPQTPIPETPGRDVSPPSTAPDMSPCERLLALSAHAMVDVAPIAALLNQNEVTSQWSCVQNPDGKSAFGLIPVKVQQLTGDTVADALPATCEKVTPACGDEDSRYARLDVRLVYMDPQGVLMQGNEFSMFFSSECSVRTSIGAPFDFNGDGIHEVPVQEVRKKIGQRDVTTTRLFTITSDRVHPYAPSTPYAISHLSDVDADGRPDLVLSYRFEIAPKKGAAKASPAPQLGPDFVAHSLPDGTFSTEDAVATGPWLAYCPVPKHFEKMYPPKKNRRAAFLKFQKDAACSLVWGNTEFVELVLSAWTSPATGIHDIAPADGLQTVSSWVSDPPPPILQPVPISLCGVLSNTGNAPLSLLVPMALNNYRVRRYELINGGVYYPPIEYDAGWWICVQSGRIISHPDEEWDDSYGKIVVTEIISDKTNAEKGME